MPDFWPYLIFRLYLSRMQKYAFFPASPNILGEILRPPAFFFNKNTGNRGNKNQATEETKSSQLRKSQKKAVSLHWHI